MNKNLIFKGVLLNTTKQNNKDLEKLTDTDRLALEKVIKLLDNYNQDVPYKTMMPYTDEPRILLNKLKEYYID